MKLPNQRLKLPNAPVYQRRIFAAAANFKPSHGLFYLPLLDQLFRPLGRKKA